MQFVRKNLRFFILSIMMILAINTYAIAGNAPDWMNSGGDVEEKIGDTSEKVFKLVLLIAAACGAIGFGIGLAAVNGIIGEAEKGPQKIKMGLLTMVLSGMGLAIVQFFTSL